MKSPVSTQTIVQSAVWLTFALICSDLRLIAQAQIVPDNTLGVARSQLTPNALLGGNIGLADRIDGGAQRGSNLFHSFSQLNVADGQRVYFANPTGVQNILTRVTGGNASNILGTLGVNGAANLYLLNPNGIIFGPNAQLDVRGSFVGSTASGVQFGDQGFFSVNQTDAPPLLTIQPSALLFTQQSTGSIVSSSVAPAGTSPSGRNLLGLQVPTGQSLILAGGDIRIDGGGINGGLNAQGGRIELGGLVGEGRIGLDNSNGQPKLVFPNEGVRGNVALVNNARVAGRGVSGGDVVVNANLFTASGGGRIVAGAEGAGNAGDILVNANVINFSGESADGITSGLSNQVLDIATGRGGNIQVNTNQLTLTAGASIDTTTFGQGGGGDILINARDFVFMDNSSPTPASNTLGYIGSNIQNDPNNQSVQGGKIKINTGNLTLLNSAQIINSVFGHGNAGEININAKIITLQGRVRNSAGAFASGFVSSLDRGAVGNAGNILVQTDSLNILDGAAIDAFTRGRGNAGNIKIIAKDSILLSNTIGGITNGVAQEGIGQGGTIQIQAPTLTLANQSTIQSNMTGRGNAGSILIDVDNLLIERQGDFSPTRLPVLGAISANTTGVGNAGNIIITARDRITLNDGRVETGVIDAGTDYPDFIGKGQGGTIQITAKEIDLNNSGIEAGSTGEGNSGSISINAENILKIRNKSYVGTGILSLNGSKGTGNAGDILLLGESILLENGAFINSATDGKGNAGNIKIQASKQLLIDKGNKEQITAVSTSVSYDAIGKGGNIEIIAPQFSLLNGGDIFAATIGRGDSGDVSITAETMTLDRSTILSSTGGQGNAGNITLNIDRTFLNNSSAISSEVVSDGKYLGQGDGGNLSITGKSLSLSGGSNLNTSAYGIGRAGNVSIQASESVNLIGMDANNVRRSGIYSIVGNTGKGQGGTIQLTTSTLTITDDAAISASTFGQGKAGDIFVNANRGIFISGTDRLAESSGLYTISRSDSPAGDIFVTTPRLTLNNHATLRTESNTSNGGNIDVNADLVLLRRNSNISATAGLTQGNGNGGNINMRTNLIVAVPQENSDITANAFAGSGGEVKIQTNGLFGIAPRSKLTPLSDITASSEQGVQGTIAITQPDVQPEQGLLQLPTDLLDASNQLAQTCANNRTDKPIGSFVVTGRGSLPPTPIAPLAQQTSLQPLATIGPNTPQINAVQPSQITQNQIITEAQGWIKSIDGKILLVSEVPSPPATDKAHQISNDHQNDHQSAAFACASHR